MKTKEIKDCLFQYATRYQIFEDTGLITREEADNLVQKYLEHIKQHWNENESPQMCIWIDCKTDTDYGDKGFDIDYFDCELINDHFYRITKTKLI